MHYLLLLATLHPTSFCGTLHDVAWKTVDSSMMLTTCISGCSKFQAQTLLSDYQTHSHHCLLHPVAEIWKFFNSSYWTVCIHVLHVSRIRKSSITPVTELTLILYLREGQWTTQSGGLQWFPDNRWPHWVIKGSSNPWIHIWPITLDWSVESKMRNQSVICTCRYNLFASL